jgi:hypothetical protein
VESYKEALLNEEEEEEGKEEDTETKPAGEEGGERKTSVSFLDSILSQANQEIQNSELRNSGNLHQSDQIFKNFGERGGKKNPELEALRKELLDVASPANNFSIKAHMDKANRADVERQWVCGRRRGRKRRGGRERRGC